MEPPWDLAWQRHYQQASLRHSRGEKLTQPGDTRTYRQWLRDPGADLTHRPRTGGRPLSAFSSTRIPT